MIEKSIVKKTIDFLRISACNIYSKVGKKAQCMRETRIIEFKEKIANTFLKTVSACVNYDGREIYFGIDDNGNFSWF